MFSENKVSVIKCNFTLDEEVQNFTQYNSFIQLRFDEVVITNKVIIEKPEYVLEADQDILKKVKLNRRERENSKTSNLKSFKGFEEDGFEKDYLIN